MGAVGMNSATREVDDHTQRLRVANAAWFRWAPIVGLSVTAHVAGALGLGRLPPRAAEAGRGRALAWLRFGLTAAALAATAETGRSGRQVVAAGDVPVATAVQPISATPDAVAAAQRRLRIAQWLVPAFTAGLWTVEALQASPGRAGSDARR